MFRSVMKRPLLNAVQHIRLCVWVLSSSSSFSGNSLKRTPTCRCTWRRRATRRSVWVALMRNCCGVFRRANWAPGCPPAPPPSIDPPLDHVPPLVRTPTISDSLSADALESNAFFFLALEDCFFFKSLSNVPPSFKGRILHFGAGWTDKVLRARPQELISSLN